MGLLQTMVHQISSVAPGTGSITLPATAASASRRTALDAFGTGNTGYFCAEGDNGFECFIGTVTGTSTAVLTRDTVIINSLGTTAKINFTGIVNVWSGLPAEKAVLTVNDVGPDVTGNIEIDAGGGSWGSLTGTLSDQTDLQAALNAKADASSVLLKNGSVAMTGLLTLSGDPSSALQAATKQYVDNVAAGLDIKPSCRLATTADDTLSGLAARDGVTPAAGNRVLVTQQTSAAQNGIYVAASGAWSRASDMDNWLEVPGAMVVVEEGTAYGDTGWVCTANAGGTIGTTAIVWTRFFGTGLFQPASSFLSSLAAGQYPGTATNDNAAAGKIGEIIESEVLVGAAVSLGTSGSVKNITSIALSAGDWDVEGNIIFTPLGGNLTAAVATMNTASATFPTRPNGGAYAQVGGISTTNVQALVTGRRRYSFATPTTVYLIAYADFAGTPTAYGYIGARRIR